MKKQTKAILIIAIALVLAVIFIYPRWDQYMGKSDEAGTTASSGGPQGSGQPIPVNVVEIRPERLENNLSVTGTIIPNESVDLRSEISGLVKKITFNDYNI